MNNQMEIKYLSASDFYEGVAEMVKYGLTFKADFASLTIVLTGGY